MSNIDEILNQLDLNSLANQLGADPGAVQDAARNALPALLMGLGANAQDPAGEASIVSALADHDPHLLDNPVDPSRIDTEDGQKITRHIFGDNQDAVVQQLGGIGGGNQLVQRLLPILAPIVMAWLAKRMQGQPRAGQGGGGGVLGDILGQVLGGSAPQQRPQQPPQQEHREGQPRLRAEAEREAQAQAQQERVEQPEEKKSGGGLLGDLLGGLLGRGRR